MSLYDGLDSEPGGGKPSQEVAGWGSNFKLMKTQKELNSKKQNALLGGRQKRSTPTVAPVMDLRGKKSSSNDTPLYFNQLTGRMEKVIQPPNNSQPPSLSDMIIGDSQAISSTFLGAVDEYDPLHPNDYEDYLKQIRKRKDREREQERVREQEEREKRRRERHEARGGRGGGSDEEEEEEDGAPPRRRRRDSDEEDEDAEEKRKYENIRSGTMGAAIAPPSALLEQDSRTLTPNLRDDDDDGPTGIGPKGFGFVSKGGSIAAKIMSRMGYKMGQGLGKKEQGMSTALTVEKTGKRAGKIIHERDIPKAVSTPPRQDMSNTNVLKNPSKVVLLRNMVGPGEVDEELEQETLEECQKYGKCLKCLIFEMPDAVEIEAVRIFVEFEKIDSAIKAIIDLNGRFFGGRQVRACFYNLDKYRRLNLADAVDQ